MDTKYQCLLEIIYRNPSEYVSWPQKKLLLLPGVIREKYHQYPENIKQKLKEAHITPDSRSNGPAICSFLLAGGVRPLREDGSGWNIHHIYDGKFPFHGHMQTLHAARDGQYFTEAAGLVALHPIAHAAADEFYDFAWWLRKEAFIRFRFDPDKVFKI
ncbi:MAG TPA: hypothetical protein PKW33_02710 [Anaerolineaceae bacterium]|nr:hypothetical protein [Anaerolineaceae bacterium]HPN50473.1 hypothetical protein [Anaerolineaceae bacterium]